MRMHLYNWKKLSDTSQTATIQLSRAVYEQPNAQSSLLSFFVYTLSLPSSFTEGGRFYFEVDFPAMLSGLGGHAPVLQQFLEVCIVVCVRCLSVPLVGFSLVCLVSCVLFLIVWRA